MLLPRRTIHDVLVIGSGASGGWVAKELTERGLTVAMLEAGPPRVPTHDFTEHMWPYQMNEKAMAAAMRENITAILDEMKLAEMTPPKAELSIFGKNIHECGTARMGNDPKKSVVDRNCKVHDARNVFVTDGAVFVTQGCYEPTLTIMAISARAGEHIAETFRRGEL